MAEVASKNKANQNKDNNQTPIIAKARIDSKAELIEPIDYSFRDLMNLTEINDVHPRYPSKLGEPKKIDGKFVSLGLKLGYNALKDIDELYEWTNSNFAYPNQICSLDLSFNCFDTISKEILKFEGLKYLYLHGNKIIDLTEVDKLAKLKNLSTLTLHGNPIENLIGFRHYIISKLPGLKHLNFSGISKAERQTAITWTKSNNKPLKIEIQKEKKEVIQIEED